MSRDPQLVDSDEIIVELCRFHTCHTDGARNYPTMYQLASGYLTVDDFRSDVTSEALHNRGTLVAEACRLQRTATSTTQGDLGFVPYSDGREIIRWSDFHAGIMPAGTRQSE